jgi:hypothetical protein
MDEQVLDEPRAAHYKSIKLMSSYNSVISLPDVNTQMMTDMFHINLDTNIHIQPSVKTSKEVLVQR